MKRMIYCSQAEIDFSPEELVELLELARLRNAEAGLTGMLLYCSQSFLQMLEGETEALGKGAFFAQQHALDALNSHPKTGDGSHYPNLHQQRNEVLFHRCSL